MVTKAVNSRGRVALLLVAGLAASLLLAGPASATEVIWQTDFAFIHFDWHDEWDKEVWWAYAMWYLDIPDWAYLFAVYGLGWDHIWGPLLWGSNGTWGSEDKIHLYFYTSDDGLGGSYPTGTGLYLNLYYLPELDLVGGGWVNPVCTAGRRVAYETTRDLVYTVAVPDYLEYPIALHVAYQLWPWGDNHWTLGLVQDGFRTQFPKAPLDTYLSWYQSYVLYDNYTWYANHNGVTETQYQQSLYTLAAWGYVLEDYDHLFTGAADQGGASSNYRLAAFITYWRGHGGSWSYYKTLWDESFAASYGHVASLTLGCYHDPLKEVGGDLNGYLYYLMWGHWYSGG